MVEGKFSIMITSLPSVDDNKSSCKIEQIIIKRLTYKAAYGQIV